MSVNVDVADVAGLVPLSLQVGFWRWRCRCPLVWDLVSAGVCRFVILPLQVSASMWCCQCRCLQVCDVAIAGVCRHWMLSLQVSAGMWSCCRCLQACDVVIVGVCRHVMLSLQVYAGMWCWHCRCMQACDVVIAGVRQCVLRSPGSRLLPGRQCGAEQRHQRKPGARNSPRDDAYVRLPQRMVCCGLLEGIIRQLRVSLSRLDAAGICVVFFLLSVLWRTWYRRCWI